MEKLAYSWKRDSERVKSGGARFPVASLFWGAALEATVVCNARQEPSTQFLLC